MHESSPVAAALFLFHLFGRLTYTCLRYAWFASFTSDKGGRICDCPRCLSLCLLARLIKNACVDLDEILRVDMCRDMDELINF